MAGSENNDIHSFGFSLAPARSRLGLDGFLVFVATENVTEQRFAAHGNAPVHHILVVDTGFDDAHGLHHRESLADKISRQTGAFANGGKIAIDKIFLSEGTKYFDIIIGKDFPRLGLRSLGRRLKFGRLGKVVFLFLLFEMHDLAFNLIKLPAQSLRNIFQQAAGSNDLNQAEAGKSEKIDRLGACAFKQGTGNHVEEERYGQRRYNP